MTQDSDPGGFADADIDLPPMAGGDAKRLLVLLHGAGSTPGQLVMGAVAWQLKFRSARAILLAAPHRVAPALEAATPAAPCTDQADGAAVGEPIGRPQPRYWIEPAEYPVQPRSVRGEAEVVAGRIRAWQEATGLDATRTVLIGFSQGASIALELAFAPHDLASVIVAFAPRLYRIPVDGDRVDAVVHLIHGRYDSVVPLAHGEAALRRLGAVAPATSLDVIEDGGHAVTQDHLNVATQRVMRTLLGGRRPGEERALH